MSLSTASTAKKTVNDPNNEKNISLGNSYSVSFKKCIANR